MGATGFGRARREGRVVVHSLSPELSKMKVLELRALAKQRRVSIPIGSSRAKIIKLLS